MEHPVLFSTLLGVPEAYKHIFYTWVAMIILFIVGYMLRGRMKLVPTGLQNFMEVIIGGLEDFTVTTVGEKGRIIFPLLCGIFLFIITQNLLGLVPGCDAPTANINTNAAMALFVFLYYNYVGLKTWGPGYIKHFMGPMLPLAPLMLPIEFVSHLARPLSLTLRLFGNIRGEEIVLLLFFTMAPVASTLPTYFLFFIAKSLQAFIFYMLTMIYLQGAMEHAH
ncbi:F0F1 ATP synthase subunit A [Desulfovibrio sp. OttesenSCG-928-M16]|nr:F0F1 ATP synthase subunit A [Desulfovibrio sp. OttesenSCG-928-M16]MDL2207593.1 F0F1 ATP synthase subunit A [Desulfovibrio sp. OttesenSCG-928-M16]